MKPSRHSLRGKLIAIIGVLTASALVAGFAAVIFSDVRAFRREMVAGTSLVARVVAEYSVSDLVFDDRKGAQDTLSKLAGLELIEFASLHDAAGQMFAVRGQADGSEIPVSTGVQTVRFSGGSLHLVQPVVYKGRTYGTLYLRASTAETQSKIIRHVATMVVLLVGLVSLALIFAARLQRAISGPILSLAATTREISRTDDHTIRVPRLSKIDEIVALCDGLNDMLDQIQLRELERDEALHRTREKSQFLAAMSHELRTPLNSIIGFSEVILQRGGPLDPRMQKFMTNILNSGQHLLGIINNILDLSKVEAGKMEFQPEPVLPGDIVEAVTGLMKGTADKRQIEIRFERQTDLPVIEADPVKLKQVFFNLVSNAVKFSPERSLVRIVARALSADDSPLGEPSVEIAVIDQGIGIAAADQDRIFQPFQQAEGGIARRYGGTGLGLALSKTFVNRHGGSLLLTSAPGAGSTFTVVLPVVSRGSRTARPAQTVERPGAAGEPILVVEDDQSTLDRVRQELTSAGYEVLSAATAEEAIERLVGIAPAAIVLDIVLPGNSGWEVLKRVRRQRATESIPVVIYSVHDNRELGLTLGADDFVVKPGEMGRLVASVNRLVRRTAASAGPILVIDDDTRFFEELQAVLEPLGYRLQHAPSGAQGLAFVEKTVPALIILDLVMEGMDGFETAARLSALPTIQSVPIMVVTAAELDATQRARLDGKIAALVHKGDEQRRSLVPIMRGILARRSRAAGADIAAGPLRG